MAKSDVFCIIFDIRIQAPSFFKTNMFALASIRPLPSSCTCLSSLPLCDLHFKIGFQLNRVSQPIIAVGQKNFYFNFFPSRLMFVCCWFVYKTAWDENSKSFDGVVMEMLNAINRIFGGFAKVVRRSLWKIASMRAGCQKVFSA